MKWAAYDKATGEIVSAGEAPEGATFDHFPPTQGVLEGVSATPGRAYLTGSEVREIPAQPSPHHTWDWVTKTWQPDLAGALAARKADVDRERARRNYLPIAYAGSIFDADETAQRNVSAWQTQLASGATLPPGFVWRDFDNVDHPADAAFVNGLGAAMTLRGTLLYQTAWQHKAAIEALADVGAVLAYDVTTGWPE